MTRFTWDAGKAAANLRKHGVLFEEAQTVFAPAKPAIFDDLAHSNAEWRYVAIGFSVKQCVLAVFFTIDGEVVRIISARKATRTESGIYAKAKQNNS